MHGDNEAGAGGKNDVVEEFLRIVSVLSDGELTMPSPFDLPASAALAANMDRGDIAERLFEVTAARECGFKVTISAVVPGDPAVPDREIVDTEVRTLRALTALLMTTLDELHSRISPS